MRTVHDGRDEGERERVVMKIFKSETAQVRTPTPSLGSETAHPSSTFEFKLVQPVPCMITSSTLLGSTVHGSAMLRTLRTVRHINAQRRCCRWLHAVRRQQRGPKVAHGGALRWHSLSKRSLSHCSSTRAHPFAARLYARRHLSNRRRRHGHRGRRAGRGGAHGARPVSVQYTEGGTREEEKTLPTHYYIESSYISSSLLPF